MAVDHYATLGVRPEAPQHEIRVAYLRLMRSCHPDRRPGDPEAAETALRANAAWEVLGHGARRAAYDRLRAPDGAVRPEVRQVRDVEHVRPRRPACSTEGRRYRESFTRACLRLAGAVLLVGLVLLFAAV